MKKTKLVIVILSYNTKNLLNQCLTSVFKAAGLGQKNILLEIFIVDNASSDGSVEYLKEVKPPKGVKLTTIYNDENLGFAEGNNVGVKEAVSQGADYIMLLNSDTLVKDPFWQPLVDFLGKNPRVGVVGPKIYFAPGHEYHKNRYQKKDRGRVIWAAGGEIDWDNVIGFNRGMDEIDRGQFDQPEKVDMVSGCCFLAPAKVWREVKYFDERYFLYYEDDDFCQRVKGLGFEIYYLPTAKIWHLGAGSSRVGSSLQDYFIARNRLLFGIRWAPWRAKASLIKESLRLLVSGRRWQKIGVRDYYLKRFGQGSWKK